jgi:protein TonB
VTVTLLLSMYLPLSPRLDPSALLPKAPPLSVLAGLEMPAGDDERSERAAGAPAEAREAGKARHTVESPSRLAAPKPAYPSRRPRSRYVSGDLAVAPSPAPVAIASELKITSGFGVTDGELQPIIGTPPEYPAAAAARNLQGQVVVEYTISRTGAVTDLVVIDSSHDLFRRAALDAAQHFRYSPRVVGGEAVDVRGVRTTVRFLLEP